MHEAATTGTLAEHFAGTAIATVVVGATSAARGWTATLNPAIVAIAPLIGLMTGGTAARRGDSG